jgi:regulator of replication initiation timing
LQGGDLKMTEPAPAAPKTAPQSAPVTSQLQALNLRIRDMMVQLSTVVKTMTNENDALKKENADLKAKLAEAQKKP